MIRFKKCVLTDELTKRQTDKGDGPSRVNLGAKIITNVNIEMDEFIKNFVYCDLLHIAYSKVSKHAKQYFISIRPPCKLQDFLKRMNKPTL